MTEPEKEKTCEYCHQPTGKQAVVKVVISEKHQFCSELCWALFRYDFPKEKIWLEWS